jgi:small subunit ribosomal protein S5
MSKLRKGIKVSEVDLQDKVVSVNRVSKVLKGGRKFSFSAIVVVGDNKGVVGYGLGKASEVSVAVQKGINNAKKNLISVSLLRDTIPHEVVGRFGGGHVLLKPASPGTGVIAGGAARSVLEMAGIHDVLSKSKGSSNPQNVVKATFNALAKLKDPIAIAKARNISLDKLFNG